MASELLSFRLSGHELDWLKNQQEEGETLNLTAKRLLLSLMDKTVDITVNTPVYTPVYTQDLEEKLERKIDERFEEMYQQISANLNYILDTRLNTTVDNSVQNQEQVDQESVDTVDTPVYTPVDSIVYTQEKPLNDYTIIELRDIAKGLQIPFKVRDNKAKLIQMISDRKSETPSHHEP